MGCSSIAVQKEFWWCCRKTFLLYNSPEMFRTDDKLCSVDADDFDACKEELGII
jgi:hypothetical protein